MNVTHLPGFRNSNLWLPTGKKLYSGDEFGYKIRFTRSCLYDPLPPSPITGLDENSSWNKLIYCGAIDPHREGCNFGWRHYQEKLQLAARIWDNTGGDDVDHLEMWQQDIQIDQDYFLYHLHRGTETIWQFGKTWVARYPQIIDFHCLSQPWFGGGAGLPWQGNVPRSKIEMDISFSK